MIACRSPVALLPPSMGVSGPNGYGPRLLSPAYRKWICTVGWALVTTMYGMPYGYPPDGPKSGCRNVRAESILRSQAALCGSTGSLEMSVFQMLSAGNMGQFGASGTDVPGTARSAAGSGATRFVARRAVAAVLAA